jgi:hypothetical protein
MSVDVEERLRRALAARAAAVTPQRLQPAMPPTAAPAARRARRRVWWPRLAGAVALVTVFLSVRGPAEKPSHPIPNPPAATVPSESPAVSPSKPAPSPSKAADPSAFKPDPSPSSSTAPIPESPAPEDPEPLPRGKVPTSTPKPNSTVAP